jgi:protein-tyrosine-phosphatase
MILAFLCFDNASLSPIAEVITRDLDTTVEVYSFGIRPAHVSRAARRILMERGHNTRGLRAKSMLEVPMDEVEVVISLVSRRERPLLPSHVRVIDWPLPDPIAAPDGEEGEACRAAYEELQRRISRLLSERRGE